MVNKTKEFERKVSFSYLFKTFNLFEQEVKKIYSFRKKKEKLICFQEKRKEKNI